MASLPSKCKPSKVLSKDKTRPRLTAAYLRNAGDGMRLEVTDSYRLAVIPVEGDTSTCSEGYIGADALKAIEKGTTNRHVDFVANGTVDVFPGDGSAVKFDRPDPGDYPNIEQLLGDPPAATFKVGINAKFLHELAQALGNAEGVELTFDADRIHPGAGSSYARAIGVRPLSSVVNCVSRAGGDDEPRGLIMPIRVNV